MPDQQKNSSQEQHKELIEPIKVNFDEASVVSRYGKKDFVKFIYVLFAFALIFIFWFVIIKMNSLYHFWYSTIWSFN